MQRALRFGIVEDNREDFLALCRILGPEHDVRSWNSAEQVLAALRVGGTEELAMLIVDRHLPGMDGLDLVRELRAVPGGDAVKIVMFSGSKEPDIVERAEAAGVDRFESKGHTIEEFKAAVSRCLTLLDDAPTLAA